MRLTDYGGPPVPTRSVRRHSRHGPMLPLPPLALVNGLVGLILGMNAPVRGKN